MSDISKCVARNLAGALFVASACAVYRGARSGNEIYCNQQVRSGGQSHFHAPPAIKSWAACGLIMRARIYVNAAAKYIHMNIKKSQPAARRTRIIHFVLFSLGLRLAAHYLSISWCVLSLYFHISKCANGYTHEAYESAKANWFAWTKFGTASRKNVLGCGDLNFSAGTKSPWWR